MEPEANHNRREGVEAAARQRVRELSLVLQNFLSCRRDPVGLEIGCGHGHWLTSMAEKDPHHRWVGVDLITKRIDKARKKAEKRALDNVLFLKAEASELLRAWPTEFPYRSVFLLYPDPWPKKRHAKNRLTRPSLLGPLAEKATKDAVLYFRTDDPDFFAWTQKQLEEHPQWEISSLPWPHEHGSYFQDLLGIHDSITAKIIPGST